MFLTVDLGDKRPIYQQVVDGVKTLIAGGELREGMALPSVRQVAGDLGVNLNTVAIAYRQLQDEGFLKVRHGSGAVVSSRRGSVVDEGEVRSSLRTFLTRLVLAGYEERAICDLVRQELAGLHQKGTSR
jgi:GntR family transcriptional regulator